jgi:hypothetical protein
MVKTRGNAAIKVPALAPERPKRPGITEFGERFFAYLVREKGEKNPGMMELIYCLGDDGRQEMLLSIFNFLRSQEWRDFCKDRRTAKKQVQKLLGRAIGDFRRATVAYRKVLTLVPEVDLCRNLGEGGPWHLSDILDREAAFFAAQARIERVAARKKLAIRGRCSGRPRENASRQSWSLLLKASIELTRAANSYRRLLTLTSTAVIGKTFDSLRPSQLSPVLGSETTDLRGVLSRVDSAFYKKRMGTRVNWAILVGLQDFIKEFGQRWVGCLPPNAASTLSENDLADLLEAGKTAWGVREDSTLVNADSIGRSLERFRQHAGNSRTCLTLRNRAHVICDRLRLRPPASQIA